MKTKQSKNESPLACNMAALDDEQRSRWETLLRHLGSAQREIRELPSGYAFRFPTDASMIRDLSEWITYERLCCPFLDFELEVKSEGDEVWLKLSGREGVKEFLQSEFGI